MGTALSSRMHASYKEGQFPWFSQKIHDTLICWDNWAESDECWL